VVHGAAHQPAPMTTTFLGAAAPLCAAARACASKSDVSIKACL